MISTHKFVNNLADRSVNGFGIMGLSEVKDAIAQAIDDLPEKEKQVISLYYYDELTMKEIGK
ncbi:MAG: RNA polymerase sigma factor WhiG, partial [Deltaproteobacteria bacterium]|nr:RNA polymerase sigma factor WhiG [Deltaproteobacteria bacterium]